jgi:UDP-galactopyranose mutase
MPVTATPLDTQLRITFLVDKDLDGNPINPPIKTVRTYGPFKRTANNQDLWDFVAGLAELQEYSIDSVLRVDQTSLVGS